MSNSQKLPTSNILDTSTLSVLDKSKGDGEDIDWDHFIDWDMPACQDIVELAYTVCLNGPVHVHKQRSWPGLKGTFSIADKFKEAEYPKPITNAAWKKFCEVVSQNINCSLGCVESSDIFKKYGKLWPSCAAEYATDGLVRVIKKTEIMHQNRWTYPQILRI